MSSTFYEISGKVDSVPSTLKFRTLASHRDCVMQGNHYRILK